MIRPSSSFAKTGGTGCHGGVSFNTTTHLVHLILGVSGWNNLAYTTSLIPEGPRFSEYD
jgi:hypothetical protein